MSDSQWLWDPLISVKWGRLGKLRPVVALPRKEISCKLIVKNETLKEGCHEFTALEPDELAPIWGVDAAFPRLPASTWLEVSRPPGRDVTPDMLTMNRAPWDVSPDDPAILSIHNEYGGLHSLQIHTVRQESCSDGERCPICFDGDSDVIFMLQCGICKGVVYLGCRRAGSPIVYQETTPLAQYSTVDVMDRSALSYARRPLKMLPASRQQKNLSMPQTH
ncbi:hypothetical protein N7534_003679 [Penicillium rubens]|nr:hypothetical protein N7534_003679 [Penicillium rubens]